MELVKRLKLYIVAFFYVIIPRLDRADGATRVFFLINCLSYTQNTATVSVKDLYLLPPYHPPKTKFLMLAVTYSDKSPAYVLAAFNNGVVSGESI